MNKTFQVLIPFDGDKGGMESLHQLVYFLKKFNVSVEIVYTLSWRKFLLRKKTYHPKSMEKYCKGVPIKKNLEDRENNIIFIPEIFTSYVKKMKYAKINIFWLSVNNYYVGFKKFNESLKWIVRGKYGIGILLHPHFQRPLTINEINKKNFNHIAQSIYAEKFIHTTFGKKPIPIYDFTEDIPQKNESFFNLGRRDKVILYNPVKGIKVTQKIIKKYKFQYQFVPIKNMSHKEVRELLSKSFIYIDFGEHPGRDRIPREAIMCGCCIITGYRGSAAFNDVPIDSKFKLFEDENLIENFGKLINELVIKSDCSKLFKDAYETIAQDKAVVKKQVKSYLDSL